MTPRFQISMTLALIFCSAVLMGAVLSNWVSRELIELQAAALCFMGACWVGMLFLSWLRALRSKKVVEFASEPTQGDPSPAAWRL